MRTAIRSRTRSALTGLTVLLTVTIVIAGIVFAVLRLWPSQRYAYQSYQVEVSPAPPWRPGQTLSLLWLPVQAGSTVGAPRSLTCHFWLFGPYATHAEAQADLGSLTSAGGTAGGDGYTLRGAAPVASAPLLQLSADLAAPVPDPVTYSLPDLLAPGYYVVVGYVDAGRAGSASSSFVAEVAA